MKSDIIREFIEKNGMVDDSERATARAIFEANPGVWNDLDNVRNLMRSVVFRKNPRPCVTPKVVTREVSTDSLSETQLRELFDVKTIVTNALNSLKPGEFWREPDFIRRNLNGKSGYRSVLESNLTQPFRGKASGQVFYSHPASIEKMKEEGVLL